MTTRDGTSRTEQGARGMTTVRAAAGFLHGSRTAGDVPSRKVPPRVIAFREEVWKYWRENGRHDLPWRKTRDPYAILASEIMLQQTQVERVIPFYERWLREFPTAAALSRASLEAALRAWNGLGYNRRAKYLHDAAKRIASEHGGRVPREYAILRTLPGAGDYTARAVRVFAYDEPDVLLETNIRAAFIHHFFPHTLKVHDREILVCAQKAAERQDSRTWHWALMDYGTYLKEIHPNPSRRSAHHARQSRFEGSVRQVRGAILRARARNTPIDDVRCHYASRFDEALASLKRDGLL